MRVCVRVNACVNMTASTHWKARERVWHRDQCFEDACQGHSCMMTTMEEEEDHAATAAAWL